MKSRLKELRSPIWGAKVQLWERLQQREAEVEYHRSVEASKKQREEDLNKDPTLRRVPMVLPGPEAPSPVEKELPTCPLRQGVNTACEAVEKTPCIARSSHPRDV